MAPASSLTKSRFLMVYIGLGLLFVASVLGYVTTLNAFVAPKIIGSRAETIERIIRTNNRALELNDHRAVRDELLRSGYLGDDRDFAILRPSRPQDQARLQAAIADCHQVTDQTCVRGDDLLVFSSARRPLLDHSSFVVELKNTRIDQALGMTPWLLLGAAAIAALLSFIGFGIRQQEKFFLKKLSLITENSRRVSELLKVPGGGMGLDEFDAVNQSLEQLAVSLNDKAKQVEVYRSWLARKTRKEQLELTLRHAAHDIRAPLEETAELCRHLPLLMDRLSQEKVVASFTSLEKRVRAGLHSLDTALKSTVEQNSQDLGTAEVASIGELFNEIRSRRTLYPELSQFTIQTDISDNLASARIRGSSSALLTAFWNLALNAAQARRDGTLTISASSSAEFVCLDFKDNGPGIPEALLEDIFLEFVTTRNGGTGIGLSSARRVIEASGGQLFAVSSRQGAHFQALLPVVDSKPEVNHAQA